MIHTRTLSRARSREHILAFPPGDRQRDGWTNPVAFAFAVEPLSFHLRVCACCMYMLHAKPSMWKGGRSRWPMGGKDGDCVTHTPEAGEGIARPNNEWGRVLLLTLVCQSGSSGRVMEETSPPHPFQPSSCSSTAQQQRPCNPTFLFFSTSRHTMHCLGIPVASEGVSLSCPARLTGAPLSTSPRRATSEAAGMCMYEHARHSEALQQQRSALVNSSASPQHTKPNISRASHCAQCTCPAASLHRMIRMHPGASCVYVDCGRAGNAT